MVDRGEPYRPGEFYRSRLSLINEKLTTARKRLTRLALLRLAIFIVTITLAVLATRWSVTAVVIILIAGIFAFILSIISYISLQRRISKLENLANINENELKALAGDFSIF